MRTKIPILVTTLLISPAACVDEGENPDDLDLLEDHRGNSEALGAPENAETVEIAPFVEIEVGPGHTVSFYADPESSPAEILATETAPTGSALILREAKRAGATSLEVFLGLAEQADVPSELRAAHVAEALNLGRPDDAIQPFDARQTSPTANRAACDSYSSFKGWFESTSGESMVGYQYGTSWHTLSETSTVYQEAYMGGCNKNGGDKKFFHCWLHEDSNIWWCSSEVNVSAGSTYYAEKFMGADEYYWSLTAKYPTGVTGASRLGWDLDPP